MLVGLFCKRDLDTRRCHLIATHIATHTATRTATHTLKHTHWYAPIYYLSLTPSRTRSPPLSFHQRCGTPPPPNLKHHCGATWSYFHFHIARLSTTTSTLHMFQHSLKHTATLCNVLQHTATHGNTLPHTESIVSMCCHGQQFAYGTNLWLQFLSNRRWCIGVYTPLTKTTHLDYTPRLHTYVCSLYTHRCVDYTPRLHTYVCSLHTDVCRDYTPTLHTYVCSSV